MLINRRTTLGLIAATGASLAAPYVARAAGGRVVVIGGGFGGATIAARLKARNPAIAVTLVEPGERYVSLPMSNAWLGGAFPAADLVLDYGELRARWGIEHARTTADDIDPVARTVRLASGGVLPYDALVLSPGIDIRWDALAGYDEAAATRAPHAWKSGAEVAELRARLEAMPDGGTFVMVVPDNPYRCPPAPYERASMIAHYFSTAKPASKVLILDAKDSFAIDLRFLQTWPALYGDMISWVGRSDDGRIVRVDAEAMAVETEFGEIVRADVLNVIPPQKAGWIADRAGVTDLSGWAPVHHDSFESLQQPGTYVIGDAAVASPMPKSASSAAAQAEIAAAAIAARLDGRALPPPVALSNVCYSLIAPDFGVSTASVYRLADGFLAEIADPTGGISPPHYGPTLRAREAANAIGWYRAATAVGWGRRW